MQEARSDRLRQLAARVAAGVVLLAAMTGAAVVGRHAAHLRGAVLLSYALAIVAAARLLCLRGTLLVGTVGILCSVFLLAAGSSDGIQLAAETGQLAVITALLTGWLRAQQRADLAAVQRLETRAGEYWQAITDLATSRRSLSRAFHELLRAREDERRRLARELHDGAVQQLMGLIIAVKSSPPDRAAETVDQQGRLVINELRRLVGALRPPGLEELGVSVALEQHVHALSGPRVPRLVVELDPVGPRELAWEATMAVFRVAQEAIRNVIQHAGATQARITLCREDAMLWLTVTDDGVGFEAPPRLNDLTLQMTQAHHFGLANMVEWAASVDGRLTIASQPGQGTQVQLSVPLRGKAGDG